MSCNRIPYYQLCNQTIHNHCFHRWSLKLYGTQSDPNSDNSEDHAWYDEEQVDVDWKENVVREAPLGKLSGIKKYILSLIL